MDMYYDAVNALSILKKLLMYMYCLKVVNVLPSKCLKFNYLLHTKQKITIILCKICHAVNRRAAPFRQSQCKGPFSGLAVSAAWSGGFSSRFSSRFYEGVSRNRRNLCENVMMRLFSLRNYDVPSLT